MPKRVHPDTLFGFHIPGLGLISFVVITLATGIVARNYFGQKLISIGDRILSRIPIGRNIYSAFKQLIEALMTKSSGKFRKAVLIEFPRKGTYAIGFLTSQTDNRCCVAAAGKNLLNIFVPHTPNPTTGYFIMTTQEELTEIPLSIEEAAKLLFSAGIVTKRNNNEGQGSFAQHLNT